MRTGFNPLLKWDSNVIFWNAEAKCNPLLKFKVAALIIGHVDRNLMKVRKPHVHPDEIKEIRFLSE